MVSLFIKQNTAEEVRISDWSSDVYSSDLYDFYLYGLLATALSHHFFAGVNETTGFILALMAFAAGFAVRPFGALVFGRVGDIVGRKNRSEAGRLGKACVSTCRSRWSTNH